MPGDWSSREYRRKSLVQQGAAEKLIRLLALRGTESVLDVGCGPGNVTSMLAGRTSGRVVGVDPSDSMIREARSRFADIEFRLIAAEDLDYNGDFDVVFCNSALQWFTDPAGPVRAHLRALEQPLVLPSRRGGLPRGFRGARSQDRAYLYRPRVRRVLGG